MADGGWYYYGVVGAVSTSIVHLNTVDKNSIFIYFWARTTDNQFFQVFEGILTEDK